MIGDVMIKAIIFDMDGLLVDSEPVNYETNRLAFERYGIKISKEEFIKKWVLKGEGSKELIKNHNLKIPYDEFKKMKKELHIRLIRKKLRLKPHAKEILKKLKKRYKLALATHGHKHNVLEVLKKFKLSDYFDTVLTREDVKRRKPNPDIFLTAVKNLKVKPNECVVIEDSERGIKTAKRARMKCIAVPDEFSKEYNDFSKADLVVESLSEINSNVIEELK